MDSDAFDKAVLAVPANIRSICTSKGTLGLSMPIGGCYFGVPQHDYFGWTRLDGVPEGTNRFFFYLGGDAVELLTAFSASNYTTTVEYLTVGGSSFNHGGGFDYSKIVSALAKSHYPNLKHLALGVWELFSNSHCVYGTLGDITDLLHRMPNLEHLTLGGSFQLTDTFEFGQLRELTVNLDDYVTGINGGFITNETLGNLLNSNFPCLEEIWMDLECNENDYEYRIPDAFLSGRTAPKVNVCEFNGGFAAGEKTKLETSRLASRAKTVHSTDMIELSR